MTPESQMHDRTALILYGSETGNAQEMAEEMGRITERLLFSAHVAEFDSVSLSELLKYNVVLYAISTTGQGEVPSNARTFWRKLRNNRLQPGCFNKLRIASFGLGDSSYPQFNWAHRKFYNRLSFLGAIPFIDRGEADEQHPEGTEGCFLPWSVKLRQALLDLCPLPSGSSAVSDEAFLIPKWMLKFDEESKLKGAHESEAHNSAVLNPQHDEAQPATNKRNLQGRKEVTATLTENRRLTPTQHWQDVRLFDFETEPVDYTAGDVLTIFPKNDPKDVDTLLDFMKWRAHADRSCHFEPTSPSSITFHTAPLPGPTQLSTLRRLLTDYLDINAIPRRSFFAHIAHFTEDETQKERLLDFTNSEYIDELYDYTTRPRRSIIEVLQEFDTLKIPPQWAASIFPQIRGRQFSIASGGELKKTSSGHGRIQLLVAIVKYRTVIKKTREGLCTKYMAGLTPGTRLTTLLCKGGLKHDSTRPAVMIGPGTGLAPLRSMLYERAMTHPRQESAKDHDPSLLFIGGRNRTADFFFEDEWTYLRSVIDLKLHTAFSRDQKDKIYVQDVIRQQGAAVFSALQKGSIYICGSSGKMPQAVREALLDVVEKERRQARGDAEAWFQDMETQGRYQQETW